MKISVFKLQNGHKYMVEITTYNVHRVITLKAGIQELWFLCSADCFVLLYICTKFHENICIFMSQSRHKYMTIYNVEKAITPQVGKAELWFLFAACHHMVLDISVKFHENISKGFQVIEWTQFCDGRTDGWTDHGKNNISPYP